MIYELHLVMGVETKNYNEMIQMYKSSICNMNKIPAYRTPERKTEAKTGGMRSALKAAFLKKIKENNGGVDIFAKEDDMYSKNYYLL
jgi:hypothetical protein